MLTKPNSAAIRIAHHGRNVKENDNAAAGNLQIFFIIRQAQTVDAMFDKFGQQDYFSAVISRVMPLIKKLPASVSTSQTGTKRMPVPA